MVSPSSSSSSSPFPSPSLPFTRSPHFTPIPEHDMEEEEEGEEEHGRGGERGGPSPQAQPKSSAAPHKVHHSSGKKKKKAEEDGSEGHVVNCNKCRPSSREKISVVPLDGGGAARPSSSSSFTIIPSPNTNILKNLFSSITRKSPRPSSSSAASSSSSSQKLDQERAYAPHKDDDHWRVTAAELSRKLLHATRKRDDAVLESSRLKQSMSELEKKLTKLESYCHDLKSTLDRCGAGAATAVVPVVAPPFPLDAFLRAVSEARTMVRNLSRSLAGQIRQLGTPKTVEKISLHLRRYGGGGSGHRSLVFHLEALLNRIFYEDFETTGFDRGGSDVILDPFTRCESNRVSYHKLKALSWEDVLSRGTRYHSEQLSGFCDRKMSDVVGMLGWTRAWPEPLLQAFFGASKSVWLAHLLAWSAHPAVPPFRVQRGVRFEPGYMEDVTPAEKLRPAHGGSVWMMVAPGFYVHSSVIKCKVLCVYGDDGRNGGGGGGGARTDDRCAHVAQVEGEITPLAD